MPVSDVNCRCLLAFMLLLAPISGAYAQIPEPDAAEKTAMIARMRTAALNYSDQLKDFTCIQLMSPARIIPEPANISSRSKPRNWN